MKLARALRLADSAIVAIVATDILQLARQFNPVLLTTNTHFDQKEAAHADWHIIWQGDSPSPELESRLKTGLTLVTGPLDEASQRYRGLTNPQLDALRPLAASLKIPILIATDESEPIPADVRRVTVLEQPQGWPTNETVIIATSPGDYTVRKKIAGVILAAGPSTRFGSIKQLLDYHGQPFIRCVAQTALHAGLSPVIVVTGAHAVQVEAVIQDLPVAIIRNQTWQHGQGDSIRAGVAAIAGEPIGGAVLLVADQPQVTVHAIGALVERHAAEGAAIVAPLVADRRSNPILFDRDVFADLLTLTGDVGGRAVFSNYKVDYIPWHDESLLFDVDSRDDYRKLLAWGVED